MTKDYKQQTFVMENRMTELMIDKLDEETREPVTGAVLQLTDGGRKSGGEMGYHWGTGTIRG